MKISILDFKFHMKKIEFIVFVDSHCLHISIGINQYTIATRSETTEALGYMAINWQCFHWVGAWCIDYTDFTI